MASENAAAVLGKATGSVYVERQGTRISLAEGDTVRATDKVITDSGSTAEIHFHDGSTASLSPGTTLEVKDFSFGEGAQPSFILNLAEGTMRSVSGELVKQNPEAFKIITPQATVGIRGTELFTAVMPGGQEVHAVLHIGKGHIVSITSHDGRSIVMDSALQAVNMSDGEHGSLVRQTFQLNELQQVIKSIAPSQVQKPIQPQGVEGEADPAQPGQNNQGDAAPAASATSSTVVVIIHEGESATTAQVASENTAPGAQNSATTENLLSVVEQLQGALADAGFTVAITTETMLESATAQGKNVSDTLASDTVQDSVSQIIDKPVESGKVDSVAPPDPAPIIPDPGPVNPDPGPGPGPDPGPPLDPTVKYVTYNGFDGGTTVVAADNSVSADNKLHITVNGNVGTGGELIANSEELTSTGSTHGVSAGDTIIVNGILQGTLYGDTKTVTATNDQVKETFGGDEITVGSIAGGTILGDTGAVSAGSAGTIQFGNDVITVTGSMNSGTIVGDVYQVNNTNSSDGLVLKFGEDTITIGGDLSSGSIYGDSATTAQNIYAYVPEGAKDTITVKGDMGSQRDALIVGDFGEINGGGAKFADGYHSIKAGSDNITVEGALLSGKIYGDSVEAKNTPTSTNPALPEINDPAKYKVVCGNDEITVGSMAGGLIVGDIGVINGGSEITLGNDIITVSGAMTGGTIYGDYESHSGTATLTPGTAGTPVGNDTISVNGGIAADAGAHVNIYGGFGDDIISVHATNAANSAISAVSGGEVIIDGGAGADKIITGDLLARGSGEIDINGGDGADTITTGDLLARDGGEIDIDGGEGTDTITVNGLLTLDGGSNGGTISINGGDGMDTILIKDGVQLSGGSIVNITGDAVSSSLGGDDTITINAPATGAHAGTAIFMAGGSTLTINGATGADTITVNGKTEVGGQRTLTTISGGDGGDHITLGAVNVTTGVVNVNGDAGNDVIKTGDIKLISGGTMTIDGGEGADIITVGGYDGSGGPLNGSLVINLGEDSVKDEFNLSLTKSENSSPNLRGDITINDYDADIDVIRLVGLSNDRVGPVDPRNYVLSAEKDTFSMTLSNGSHININGDFSSFLGENAATDVFNHLLRQSNSIS